MENSTIENKHDKKDEDKLLRCDICSYKCAKEVTMKKHTNTKKTAKPHLPVRYAKISLNVPECSLCDDTFNSNEEYREHINIHLIEIHDINIDYLKKGHENFECNL